MNQTEKLKNVLYWAVGYEPLIKDDDAVDKDGDGKPLKKNKRELKEPR